MKKIILIAAGFLFGSAAFAQVGTTKWGIRAGVNLAKYRVSNGDEAVSSSNSTNFQVTGYADVPVGSYFWVQPGISLQGKGGKWESDDIANVKRENSTLEIGVPVNLVAKLPIAQGTNFYMGAGPYISYAVSGRQKSSASVAGASGSSERDIEFGNSNGDDLRPFDAGVNFLAGFELGGGFQVGAGYGLGLTDLAPDNSSNSTLKNRVLSFNVGFSF